jgi:FMN phosphatase YigB (HAD superfamily)
VTAHLGATLTPHQPTTAALTALSAHLRPAAVSSSALTRLAACFTATGLDELIPPAVRFSAEDSLPVPTSKPDPAVYLHACRQLGIAPEAGLASRTRPRRAVGGARRLSRPWATCCSSRRPSARGGQLRSCSPVCSSWSTPGSSWPTCCSSAHPSAAGDLDPHERS